jgi:hypothetical protein
MLSFIFLWENVLLCGTGNRLTLSSPLLLSFSLPVQHPSHTARVTPTPHASPPHYHLPTRQPTDVSHLSPLTNQNNQSWLPDGTPHAILIWAHGIHEHCSRFEHMYADFQAAGIAAGGGGKLYSCCIRPPIACESTNSSLVTQPSRIYKVKNSGSNATFAFQILQLHPLYAAVYAWDHIGHGRSGGKIHAFPKGFDGVVADGMQYAR